MSSRNRALRRGASRGVQRRRRERRGRRDEAATLVVTAREAVWADEMREVQLLGGALIVDSAAKARDAIAVAGCLGVIIDPELPDGSGYDLCGWIRTRFRDLPILMLGEWELDTGARLLDDGGNRWTVSEVVRSRMTDPSVLEIMPGGIPMPSDAEVARLLGTTVEAVKATTAQLLEKTGFASVEELVHFMRNVPLDHPLRKAIPPARPVEAQRLYARARASAGTQPVVLVATARPDHWADQCHRIIDEWQVRVLCVINAEIAKHALASGLVEAAYIDPELPDLNAYDLAGFIRAHFRDLPLRILGDDAVDLDAITIGSEWTIHETLRAKMTDESVLEVTRSSIPVPSIEWEASTLALPVETMERLRERILEETGFETYAELLHHQRNPPRDPPS